MQSDLAAWLLSAIMSLVPAGKAGDSTAEAGMARYQSIAEDISHVAVTEDGLGDPRRNAAFMLSIAYNESSFRLDVDSGKARGDGGRSVCLMQLNLGKRTTLQGWDAEDVIADRRKCLVAGLDLVRRSFAECRHLPEQDRLSAYTTGRCVVGVDAARIRYQQAEKLLR